MVGSRGILDVASAHIEAGCGTLASAEWWCLRELTSVPWTCYPALRIDNTILQRSTIVGAVGVESVNLVLDLDDQYLPTFDALDLCFLLVAVLEVRQGGDVFELEFLRHLERRYGEVFALYKRAYYRIANKRSKRACLRSE